MLFMSNLNQAIENQQDNPAGVVAKSPCFECPLEHKSKNNEVCFRCKKVGNGQLEIKPLVLEYLIESNLILYGPGPYRCNQGRKPRTPEEKARRNEQRRKARESRRI